eukprot:12099110-Alexandrium_andersonii.AAC.1
MQSWPRSELRSVAAQAVLGSCPALVQVPCLDAPGPCPASGGRTLVYARPCSAPAAVRVARASARLPACG